MSSKITISISIIALFVLSGFGTAIDNETRKIMPFVVTTSFCSECHTLLEVNHNLKDPTKSCDTYCMKCHKEREEHHGVGVKIESEMPSGFQLTKKNRIACITCHDLRQDRYDSRSWRAESLFESVFSFSSQHKTYYLVMRNNNGQLCKKCH